MTNSLALIIEDDPQLSEIFAVALGETFQTETIMDGTQALARLADIEPQVVVLDINLPGASGVEILNYIRSDSRLAKTRVMLATANPRQAEELADKADIVLLKPVGIIQLRELAERLK